MSVIKTLDEPLTLARGARAALISLPSMRKVLRLPWPAPEPAWAGGLLHLAVPAGTRLGPLTAYPFDKEGV